MSDKSASLFRPKREMEILYVRVATQDDKFNQQEDLSPTIEVDNAEDEDSDYFKDPTINLSAKPDPNRPILTRIVPLETTQILETYANKQMFI